MMNIDKTLIVLDKYKQEIRKLDELYLKKVFVLEYKLNKLIQMAIRGRNVKI